MFKKVSLVNLRKLIKNEGFKKDPELKGYSYRKKKELLEVLEKKDIPESVIDKYRTKKKSKAMPKKEESKKQTKKEEPKKAKPEYIIKHFLKGGKMKTDRIYHNKALAIKYFDKVVNKSHDKCVLFMKKPGKMRIIKMSKHKNKDYSKTYEKAKTLFKKKY